MNKYFTEKTDGKDDVFAEDFNNAFDSVETDMNARQKTSEKNVADGYAGLDSTGKIHKEQIPETTASDVPYNGTESGLSALNVQSAIDELAADYEQGKVESDNRYLPQDIAAGTEPQTEYALAANAKNYQVYGNSVQDGTPTPESPVEIQSVGDLVTSGEYAGKYDVPVTVCGKNILPYPYSDTTKTENGITFTDNGDGTITVDGTATADIYFFLQSNITLSSGTYIMSGCPTRGSTTTYFIGFGSSTDADIGNGSVRTLPKDTTMNLFIKILNGTAISNIVFKPQLEEGSTATEYEPYRAETKHFYLDEPLRKMFEVDGLGAQYADYIDYEKQKVIRVIKELICNGDGSIAWFIGNKMTNTVSFSMKAKDSISRNGELNCNKFTTRGSGISSVDAEFVQQATLWLYVKINKSRLSGETSADFNAWLAENNLKLYYPLATPIEEPLTLAPMPLKEGTNNITTGTAIQPSNVIVDYYQNPTDVINSLKAAIVAMQSQTE